MKVRIKDNIKELAGDWDDWVDSLEEYEGLVGDIIKFKNGEISIEFDDGKEWWFLNTMIETSSIQRLLNDEEAMKAINLLIAKGYSPELISYKMEEK